MELAFIFGLLTVFGIITRIIYAHQQRKMAEASRIAHETMQQLEAAKPVTRQFLVLPQDVDYKKLRGASIEIGLSSSFSQERQQRSYGLRTYQQELEKITKAGSHKTNPRG